MRFEKPWQEGRYGLNGAANGDDASRGEIQPAHTSTSDNQSKYDVQLETKDLHNSDVVNVSYKVLGERCNMGKARP